MKRLIFVAIAAMALSTTGYASANDETGDSSAVETSCDDVTIDKPCTDLQADVCRYRCESARHLRECSVLQVENHTLILEAAIDHREEVVKVIVDRYAFTNGSADLPDWKEVEGWVTIVFGVDPGSTVLSAMLEVDEITAPTKTLISLIVDDCRSFGTSITDPQVHPIYFEIANDLYNIIHQDDTSNSNALNMIEIMMKQGVVISGKYYSVDANLMFAKLLEWHKILVTDDQTVYSRMRDILGDETEKVLARDGVGLVAGAGLGCITGGEFMGLAGCVGGALIGAVVSAVTNSTTEFIVEFWKLTM